MQRIITMTEKELEWSKAIHIINKKRLTQNKGAQRLKISACLNRKPLELLIFHCQLKHLVIPYIPTSDHPLRSDRNKINGILVLTPDQDISTLLALGHFNFTLTG